MGARQGEGREGIGQGAGGVSGKLVKLLERLRSTALPAHSLMADEAAVLCIWLGGFEVPLRTCRGPLRKEPPFSAAAAFPKLYTYARAGRGGPSVLGFVFGLPPSPFVTASREKPLNSRALFGRADVAPWTHVWAGPVGFPASGVCRPAHRRAPCAPLRTDRGSEELLHVGRAPRD